MADWFTLDEIMPHAGELLPDSLSGLQEHARREGWRQDTRRCRIRFGKGGGFEYHISLLPTPVQASLGVGLSDQPDASINTSSSPLWQAFERASDDEKRRARERLDAVVAVLRFGNGADRCHAVAVTASARKISTSALWRWLSIAESAPTSDRLPALLDRERNGAPEAACDPRAWEFIKADYLRPESARFAACYRRLLRAAEQHQWSPVPSEKTLKRRLDREFPAVARTLAREGRDAAARIYPHQTRDRSHFAPLSAMNADGHIGDTFVRFEDGEIGRPAIVVFQDLLSGVILAHRIDRTFNAELVRLTFADVVERWAIPDKLWLDNGREFASKWLTGRMKHRFRFTIKPEEPQGVFTALVGEVHWTTPYHGQAKPIERAFRDFAEDVSKHPKLAGAYTGANPMAKPDNYRSRAIPIEDYRAVVAAEVEAHNSRVGRRGRGMNKRSFLQVLNEALETTALPPRRATIEQRRMLLMAAEGVTARAPTGEVQLMGNRYWHEALADRIGRKLTVRFDPQDLKAGVSVYDLDGRFVCDAESIAATGFDDVDAARAHAKKRADFLKKQKAYLDADRRLNVEEIAALVMAADKRPTPRPDQKVVRMVANGARRPSIADISTTDDFSAGIGMIASGVVPFTRRED